MQRAPLRRGLVALAALTALLAAPTFVRTASAQDSSAEEELGDRVASDLAALRNSPFSRRDPAHALAIAQRLLGLQDPEADAGLRAILADATAPESIVRQVVIAAINEPDRRLLRDVLTRLVRERGSAFDDSLDATIRSSSDADLVHRLAALATDPAERATFRAEAARTLGRTGKPQALDTLVELWRSPDADIRRIAARACERILPAGFAGPDEAQAALDDMRERGATYWDLLADLLRQRERPAPVADTGAAQELRTLALALVERAALEQLLDLYLTSGLPEIRSAGARRVAEFPFENITDPVERQTARVRAADACLAALRTDSDPAVRDLLYAAVLPLVDAYQKRGKPLPDEEFAAISRHAGLDADLPAATRRSAVRLLGDLRDARAIAPLQITFDRLSDSDRDTRIAILDALDKIAPKQLLGWIIERVRTEADSEVATRMIRSLGESEDPAAVRPLRDLLARHADNNVRWKAARELGELWNKREFPDARTALLEVGLADEHPQVRIGVAAALSHGGPLAADDKRVMEALRDCVEKDVDAKVREQAALSILQLDESGAVKYLVRAFGDEAIWNLYRKRVIDDARARGSPERALADAEFLAGRGEEHLVDRAFALLAGVATARDSSEPGASFWTVGSGDRPVRGVIRERLARLLLEHGRPAQALRWLDELLAATRRNFDPYERWQVMAARALRQRAGPGDLDRGRQLLREALDSPNLPDDLRGRALTVLAETQLDAGRPALALDTITPDTSRRAADAKALAAYDTAELKALRARVDAAYSEQGVKLAALVTRAFGPEPDAAARDEWTRAGAVAARHLSANIAAERDLGRLLVDLRAAGHLTTQSFATERKPETTFESLQPELQRALTALKQFIDKSEK